MRFPEDVPVLVDGVGRERVTLRAHVPPDVEGCFEQCTDPLSQRWTTVPVPYARADAESFVTGVVPEGWRSGSEWAFAVEASQGGVPRFGGTVSLRDEGDGRAEVAYGSHPWVRGTGVMERAVRLLLDWGFRERRLQTVVWYANRGNWASRRLAWRLGFSFDGTVRQWLPQRGLLLDGWVGTLLAGEPREPRTTWYDVPTLVGDGVVLRRFAVGDVDRIVEACRDPECRRWLGQLPDPYGHEHALEHVETREDEAAAASGVHWAAADPVSGAYLASISVFGIRAGSDAELGYLTHPDARGRGVTTEACRLALRHAFAPAAEGGLGLGRVRAVAAEDNLASRRVLERIGMTLHGRERRLVRVQGGRMADAAVYDVLAEEG